MIILHLQRQMAQLLSIKDATVEELVMELQSRGLYITIHGDKPPPSTITAFETQIGTPSTLNVLRSIGK